MPMRALISCIVCAAILLTAAASVAQPSVLHPMSVETYRVLQRVSRNAGWASTAYRNYLGRAPVMDRNANLARGETTDRFYLLARKPH